MTLATDASPPGSANLLARLLLIASTTMALHISMMKPNPPPGQDERKAESAFEKTAQTFLRPLMTWFSLAPGIIELLTIAVRLVAPPAYDVVSGTCAERISFDFVALVSALLGLFGMAIRLWCYQALGRYFTFELALLPGHKLVTTGPYAVVRHPAYAGGLLALVSMTLTNVSKGSWAHECGLVYSWWGLVWGTLVVVSTVVMIERCPREDRFLREAFKEEWDSWSSRVRWRMVPWVF